MALRMSKSAAVYDDVVPSNRWDDAKCCEAQHLPWTDDYRPAQSALDEMSAICAECPLLTPCARFALTEPVGGFYAGVWLPWKTQREAAHRRAARVQLRRMSSQPSRNPAENSRDHAAVQGALSG